MQWTRPRHLSTRILLSSQFHASNLHRFKSLNRTLGTTSSCSYNTSNAKRKPNINRQEFPEPVLSDAQRRTIYALSTPPGKAGVAVIRVSGPDALDVWRGMVKPYSTSIKHKARNVREDPEPWKMERCRITHPRTEEILDDGLAVFFKGP